MVQMFDPEADSRRGGFGSLLDGRERAPSVAAGEATHETSAADARDDAGPALLERWAGSLRGFFLAPKSAEQRETPSSQPSPRGAVVMIEPARTEERLGPEDRPLIDPMLVAGTIWRFRFFIVFMTLLGAAVGVMTALSTPHLYVASSQFVLDPRELRVTDTDLLQQSFSSDATLALVDSQVAVVDSSPVLQSVVTELDLVDDPEFNGEQGSLLGGVTQLARSLFSNEDDVAGDRNYMTVQALSRAVSVFRASRTFIVHVEVETQDAEKSARIANTIVDIYISERQEAQSALFQRTAESLNRQLAKLRTDVELAERRVEEYKAENDLVDAGGSLITDTQLIEYNQQLAELRAQKLEIRVKAETARQLDADALLSGTAPEILQSSTIGELRAEYASAKRNFDALATSLGPRHPQRIAAEQALTTARTEISNELRRIVEATQVELQRVQQLEQQLSADLAVLKTQQVDTNSNLVRLRELEREAAATSQIYQSFLRRARETGEQQNLDTSNIRIISAATPPLQPAGPSRKFIAAGGLAAGLFLGLALALMAGVFRSLRRSADSFMAEAKTESPPAAPAAATVSSAPEADGAPLADEAPATEGVPMTDNAPEERELTVEPPADEALASDASASAHASEPDREDGERPADRHWAIGGSRQSRFQEEQDIRAEIRDLRETVERLYEARRRARSQPRANVPRGLRRADF